MSLDEYLSARRAAVEQALEALVPADTERPSTIHRAMRHSLFAGGKRVRPILFVAAAETLAGDSPDALAPACSLELIHTYSLIHDDLPALDNDDFRRGRPTCHKVFGEAMAILAGDALLTRAFQVLAEDPSVPAERRIALVGELARAAGTVEGMIGGQVEDLEAEGAPVTADRLDYIHRSKTGALLRGSVRMGAIWAGADAANLARLDDFGRHVGFAFQIVDDILDVTADSATLGKTAGKDVEQQKATFPALYGLEESRRMAREHYDAAVAAVTPLGEQALRLRQIAERVVTRSA
ncbi:MAG: polyprenyl synthetase family protein [Bryobacterales bacterium]